MMHLGQGYIHIGKVYVYWYIFSIWRVLFSFCFAKLHIYIYTYMYLYVSYRKLGCFATPFTRTRVLFYTIFILFLGNYVAEAMVVKATADETRYSPTVSLCRTLEIPPRGLLSYLVWILVHICIGLHQYMCGKSIVVLVGLPF